MSFALLFSGQGAQHPAMFGWLPDDALPPVLHPLAGPDWRQRLGDAAWAGRNAVAQPLITACALAAWQRLEPSLGAPAAVAGYSVGELAAFCAAGVLGGDTAIDLAQQRAACMDEAARVEATGLLGVSGLLPDAVEAICAAFGLQVAIRNGIDSVVLGGSRPALADGARIAAEQGAKCTPLNVALASHTAWMAGASEAFERVLERVRFGPPTVPLFSNADGRIAAAAQARSALARQISETVRWDECQDGIASRQIDCVLEIGPGQALARLWNQRYPQVPARSVDEFRSVRAVLDWVARHTG